MQPAVVRSNLAASDLVMIAGIVNIFAFQIVTVKPITSYQQLRGKRLRFARRTINPTWRKRCSTLSIHHIRLNLLF